MRVVTGAPLWVWPLLALLLLAGWIQSRPRRAPFARVAGLPIAMVAISLYGVVTTFAAPAVAIAVWAIGLGIATAANAALDLPRGVRYSPATRAFEMPGSWIPLALILAIFATRFTVGASLAMHPALRADAAFVATAAFAYGFFSGAFFAMFLKMIRLARAAGPFPHPLPTKREDGAP